MRKHLSQISIYFVLLLLGFLLIVNTFVVNFEWPPEASYTDRFIFLNRFFTDFLQVSAVLILLQSGKRLFRYLGTVLAFTFTFFYFIQSQSFAISGKYLPAVAMENADHIDFLPLYSIIFAGIIWLSLFLLVFALVFKFVGKLQFRAAFVGAIMLVLCSALVMNDEDWLSERTLDARFKFYNSGQAGVQRKSPLGELAESYRDYLVYLTKQNFIVDKAEVLSEQGAQFAYEHYGFLGSENSHFPLVRTTNFDPRIEFLPANTATNTAKKNIIVFFAEGISTKLLQPYHDYFPGLTPNITEFSKQAVRVDNYHNHTYATYRALAGQLCSIYPVGRLYEQVNYRCLAHELKAAEYQSHFFVSQKLDKTDLDTVLTKTGFENIYGFEKLLKLVPDPDRAQNSVLPDRSLFDAVIESLKVNADANQAQPFIMGVYNFETHNGIKLMESELGYAGTPENPRTDSHWLDPFYNFDRQFGRFWAYFRESAYYDNTIVVLTSDHATYPSKDYIAQLEMRNVEDYTSIFIDDIPMLIYHPGVPGNSAYDAKGASSIDFAPSMLHLLGIKQTKAPFMGQSIFVERGVSPLAGMAGSGNHILFKNHNNAWVNLTQAELEHLDPLDESQRGRYEFIRYVESLERSNQLWPQPN